MIGINNTPFIDCSPFIDIEGIKKLEKEICFGIARSEIQAGIYGPGIRDLKERKSFLTLAEQYKTPESPAMDKLTLATMSRNQRSLFFKLYEGLYNASTTVYLRDIKEKTNPFSRKSGPHKKDYVEKDSFEKTEWTDDIKYFPLLKKWIETLPFSEIGRVLFFIHEHDCELLVHKDGTNYKPHNTEFLWINPCMVKKMYIWDEDTNTKHYIDSPVGFFNTYDWHGGDRSAKMTWTLRVDGKFTDEFRKMLRIDHLENY
jgi:hypothetical protein